MVGTASMLHSSRQFIDCSTIAVNSGNVMMFAFAPALLLFLAAPPADKASEARVRVQFGQMTFRQRIIIRVPKLPEPRPSRRGPPLPVAEWKEKKAEKCLPVSSIAGAAITRAESVDLITAQGRRLRARFDDDCPTIDFYSGFYLQRAADGMICAKRDAIRSRSGDSCRIKAFRELTRTR